MRLRHGGRQNAPAKQWAQQQAQAKQRRQQRRQQQRSPTVDPFQVEDVRQLLRQECNVSTPALPPGLRKLPPKGAPVPRQLRWWSRPTATLYSDADINSAAGLLVEIELGEWPGPHQAEALYGSAKLTRAWRVKHTDQRLQKIGAIIRTYGAEPNVRRLYHGTQTTSLAGIVTQGLLCGSSGMFGGGIYLAPHFTKAFGHTGYGTSQHRYVFVADVALGQSKVMEAADSSLGVHIWEQGFQSVAGVRGQTRTRGDYTLLNDEFVVYYRDQVRLLYLAQFTQKSPVKPGT
jgi:hypothetical protein